MASELRWEELFDTGADGTTAVNAGAEFRNDSSRLLHIRDITYHHQLSTAGVDERGQIELSKSPVFASNTNNNVFYAYGQAVSMTTDVALDSGNAINGGRKYGRGQLTLEPNESLFLNMNKSSGGKIDAHYTIGYHY